MDRQTARSRSPKGRGARGLEIGALVVAGILAVLLPSKASGETGGPPTTALLESRETAIATLPPGAGASGVTVVWCDVARRLPAGFDEMSTLVSELFLGVGIGVRFREGCASPAAVTPGGIEVPITLLARDRGPRSGLRNTLGATWRGSSPRPVWIYVDAIWWTLGRGRLPQRLDADDGRWLALPLARVVAHELIHALAPDQDHEERGLMKETFDRGDLLEPLTRVDAPHLALLLDGLAPLVRRTQVRASTGEPVL